MAPKTDAHALHELVSAVQAQPGTSGTEAWAAVLDCEYATPEFVRRHAEVASLLASTLSQIDSLESEADRDRLLKYSQSWWTAVIGQKQAWNQPVNKVFDVAAADLDHLASAAFILAASAPRSASAPANPDQLDNLRNTCKEWIDLIDGLHDLPQGLRIDLLKSLAHVMWLIENVHLFGVARVASAAQATVGSVAVASRYVPKRAQSSWWEKTRALIVEIGLLASLLNSGVDAVQHGENFVSQVIQVVQDDGGATSAVPKEIEPPKQD